MLEAPSARIFAPSTSSSTAHPGHDAARLAEPSILLAAALDGIAGDEEGRALSAALRAQDLDLPAAMEQLPLYRRSILSRRLGAGTLSELVALSGELDPEIFFRSLLRVAGELSERDAVPEALALLEAAQAAVEQFPGWQAALPSELVTSLRGTCEALQGRGALGARAEILLRRFAREASHPANLIGFAAGASAYQGIKWIGLARLGAASAGVLTRAWRARALVGALALGGETLALTFSSRGLRHALGESQNWDSRTLGHELLANGITLGLLHGSGAAAESAFSRLHGTSAAGAPLRLQGFTGISSRLFPQAAMFGGIFLANRAEAVLGLRPNTDGGTALVDSLVTLLQFHIGGRMFSALQPRGFGSWLRSLEAQNRALSVGVNYGSFSDFREPILATTLPPRTVPEIFSMTEHSKEAQPGLAAEESRSESLRVRSPVNFRELFEAAPQPVLVTDAAGDIRYANGQARRIFRPSLQDLTTPRLPEWFRPHPTEEGLYLWRRDESEVTFWRNEQRALEGQEGLTAHFLTDVTELQMLREQVTALQDVNARLEAKVQLGEQFLHDEGNLLTDLSFREQLLKNSVGSTTTSEPPPSEGSGSRLRAISGNLRELGTTIGNVMELYRSWRRISAGQAEVRILTVPILLQEALRLNEGARTKQSINLVTDFSADTPVIRGEEALLINAVLNLMVNAGHAMPGGGTLTVRSYNQGGAAVIEVSDTGTGIAPEHLPHIFDLRFTTKEHSGGTGLGLPNVKTAVESLHGGRVEVESEVGRGTTFRLYLPGSEIHG